MPAFFTYAAILCLVASARAALYPNRPVANTVYEAGKEATLTWLDDESMPHLNEMPKLQLDLYGPDNVRDLRGCHRAPADRYICRKSCTPSRKSWTPTASGTAPYWLPNSWAAALAAQASKSISPFGSIVRLTQGGLISYFRFHAPKPPVDIYTARFTITSGANPGGPPNNINAAAFNASSVTNAKIAPVMPSGGPVPPNSSVVPPQNIAAAPTAAAAPAPAVGTLTSATVVPHATAGTAGLGVANAASGLLRFAGELDMEAIKFRVVFILWPALMGITLAL